jgi:hypothetical protein
MPDRHRWSVRLSLVRLNVVEHELVIALAEEIAAAHFESFPASGGSRLFRLVVE